MRTIRIAATLTVVAIGAALSAQTGRIASPLGDSATELGGRYDERQGYVGGKWIRIAFGRPIKRGRDLFGPADYAQALNDGAPVWRAGANVSTRLTTEVAMRVGGKTVEPGEYTMFVDLESQGWTLIVSTWSAQTTYRPGDKAALWGAYDYTPEKDVVRVPMTVETLPHSFDQLSWQLLDVSNTGGKLALLWDKKIASVPFTVGP